MRIQEDLRQIDAEMDKVAELEALITEYWSEYKQQLIDLRSEFFVKLSCAGIPDTVIKDEWESLVVDELL